MPRGFFIDAEVEEITPVPRIYSNIKSSTFIEQGNTYLDVPDSELTFFTMQVYERSLAEIWEDEDDEY